MGLFDNPIRKGVRAGMTAAFSKGGGAHTALSEAFDKVIAPWRDEVKRLRKIEARLKWHPIEKLPDWAKDGRPVWVARSGDVFVAAYCSEAGEEPYWDLDLEHGGTAMEPPPTDFYLLPKPPPGMPEPPSPNLGDHDQ